MWSIWDRKSDINGYPPEHIFKTFNHLTENDVIFLKTVNGEVTEVNSKIAIAISYDIDPTLANDEFIAAYEAKLAEPDEPTEPEPDETATYAELAQVYKEGVNGLE